MAEKNPKLIAEANIYMLQIDDIYIYYKYGYNLQVH